MMINNNDKIVFLDFDGVITSIEDMTSYLITDPENYKPSEICMEILKDFVIKTNSKIVITSNWRRFKPGEYFIYDGKKYFSFIDKVKEYFGDLIIDTVPCDRGLNKSQAIILWFEDNNFSGNYVIFDDMGSYEGFYSDPILSKHFIETDYKTGLTPENLDKAKEILNV